MDERIIVVICALVISVFSVGFTVWTAFLQRKHMRLSVRPIASIPGAMPESGVWSESRLSGFEMK